MKTNYIYTAALWILAAAVMLTARVIPAGAQSGADTPQVLGNKLLEGIKAKNKDALKSLIHPMFIANEKINGQLDKIINNMLTIQIPETSEFTVVSLDQVSEYNKAKQTFTTEKSTYYFPIAPTDILDMTTEVELPEKDDKGVETKTNAKVRVMTNFIGQYKGQWYIVLPEKKTDETPPVEKQK
ncbi:MAG: hypothetical protein ACHQ6U_08920 [Thermodesulfobacteriota bacterium]